ncbi:MAG: hypothetical protein WAX85_01160 [Minisyncoccia bacterium]
MKRDINNKEIKNSGFTLLVAIIITSMFLVVSFVVVNVAVKQLTLTNAARESEYAFYSADSGTECAIYWDLPKGGLPSSFATSTAGSITCSGITITTGSQTGIPATPSVSRIGGGGDANPTSIFQLNFIRGCAVVTVTKFYSGSLLITTVNSKGYNTCTVGALRRFERGVTLMY